MRPRRIGEDAAPALGRLGEVSGTHRVLYGERLDPAWVRRKAEMGAAYEHVESLGPLASLATELDQARLAVALPRDPACGRGAAATRRDDHVRPRRHEPRGARPIE